MCRTFGWLSQVYGKSLMLWTGANAWSLKKSGGLPEARLNMDIVPRRDAPGRRPDRHADGLGLEHPVPGRLRRRGQLRGGQGLDDCRGLADAGGPARAALRYRPRAARTASPRAIGCAAGDHRREAVRSPGRGDRGPESDRLRHGERGLPDRRPGARRGPPRSASRSRRSDGRVEVGRCT